MSKTILITGGSDGLGKEIAKVLTPDNKVIILSPSEEKLKSATEEIGCDYEVCDISNWGEVRSSVERIIEKYKKIDCLINNAGVWIQGELDENDVEEINKTVNVNLLGQILMTKVVIPQMKKQKQGLILFINSQSGMYSKSERTVYTATKWGLTGFTKSLQPELAEYGIGVTGIYPGKMKTQMFEKMGIEKDMSNGVSTSEVAQAVKYIVDLPKDVLIPELGIKHLEG